MLLEFLYYVGIPWTLLYGVFYFGFPYFPRAWQSRISQSSFTFYPLFLSFHTCFGTDLVYKIGRKYSRALQNYFSPSVWICAIGGVLGTGLLVFNALSQVRMLLCKFGYGWDCVSGSEEEEEEALVSFIIPGINQPLSEIGYPFVAICISVCFHELGHALAAAALGVPIHRVGFFVAGVFPGAFVDIDDEGKQYGVLHAMQKLYIVCAGVWHNILLCMVCVLTLHVAMPLSTIPLLCDPSANGILVVDVARDSGFYPTLEPGDVLLSLDGYPISSPDSWVSRMQNISTSALLGYCVPTRSLDEPLGISHSTDCCPQDTTSAIADSNDKPQVQYKQCFETDHVAGKQKHGEARGKIRYCASAKQHIRGIHERCACRNDDGVTDRPVSDSCASDSACVCPILLDEYERLVEVSYAKAGVDEKGWIESPPPSGGSRPTDHHPADGVGNNRKSFLFAGHPGDLYSFFSITECIPPTYLPRFLFLVVPYNLVDILGRVLRYTLVVSLSLAVMNSVPFLLADGGLSFGLYHDLLRKNGWIHRQSRLMQSILQPDYVVAFGTGLVFVNILFTLVSYMM